MAKQINNKKDKPYTMMEGRTKEWGRLSSSEQGDTRKFNDPSTEDHPYYDSKSKRDSYKLAVIALLGVIICILAIMVSEVVYGFDNTSIQFNKDIIIEPFDQRETMADIGLVC